MGDGQRRIRRNRVFFAVPLAFLGVAGVLLIWAVLQANMAPAAKKSWPWRLTLLDVQTAGNAVVVTTGLVLARAQYARAVRPTLAWSGEIVKSGPGGRPTWTVWLRNASSHSVTLQPLAYRLLLCPPNIDAATDSTGWVTRTEAIATLAQRGLRHRSEYGLTEMGPAGLSPGMGERGVTLAFLSREAVAVIEELFIRVRAVDEAGDTHERVVQCLRGSARQALDVAENSGATHVQQDG